MLMLSRRDFLTGTVELPSKEHFHLFLLAGQSNMAGRGEVEEQDRVADPRVLSLDTHGQWAPAVDPLHWDKPAIVGVGVGRTFGIQVADRRPEITVGLIPGAAGGSPIITWEPGGYWEQTDSHPWDDAIRRAKHAMGAGVLKAILWHQGESDSQEGEAELYEERLHALVRRFRAELNAPDAPFVAGQLGQFPDRPWDEPRRTVDTAHEALPDNVPNTAFVSSKGLTHKGDGVHFDSASLREFGRRYAAAYHELAEAGAR
ncbi:MAG: sialate O-acetylesterase [Armatimonadota bacterium]